MAIWPTEWWLTMKITNVVINLVISTYIFLFILVVLQVSIQVRVRLRINLFLPSRLTACLYHRLWQPVFRICRWIRQVHLLYIFFNLASIIIWLILLCRLHIVLHLPNFCTAPVRLPFKRLWWVWMKLRTDRFFDLSTVSTRVEEYTEFVVT